MKPLFIPLKSEYYYAFEHGAKTVEFRPYGPRWNERTCKVGRPVVLSKGYGKRHRMRGTIAKFAVESYPTFSDAWVKCYGKKGGQAACIHIKVSRECLIGQKQGEKYPSCQQYPDCICGGPQSQPGERNA